MVARPWLLTPLLLSESEGRSDMSRFLGYSKFDTANGPGVRVSIFFSGCSFRCKGCWSATAQNPRMGEEFTESTVDMVLSDCDHPSVAGLSVLGGEPFENMEAVESLLKAFRDRFGDTKTVWMWTGFYWDEIMQDPAKTRLLQYIDVLVDGRFEISQRDTKLRFRGSSNQSVIDVRKSIKADEIVWWNGIGSEE